MDKAKSAKTHKKGDSAAGKRAPDQAPNPTQAPFEIFSPNLSPTMLSDPAQVEGLQRLIGNQALQRLILQREFGVEDETSPAAPSVSDPMHTWLSSGPMPGPDGLDITGGASGMGGFNARFEPAERTLHINVNVGFTMLNGLNVNATTGAITPSVAGLNSSNPDEANTIAQLTAAAANLNAQFSATNPDGTPRFTIADRVNAVQTDWQWASGEDAAWLPQYRQAVESAWSARHFFQCREFPQLLANIRLHTNVHIGAQPNDHCSAKIIKTPPNGGVGAFVAPGVGSNPNDQSLLMSSAAVNRSPNSLLTWQVRFQFDSYEIATATGEDGTTSATTFLQQFKNSFDAASPTGGPPIQLIGHASSEGDPNYNQRLAERRALAVENHLKGLGLVGDINRLTHISEGETGATTDPSWRRVDIIVGSGEAQNVAAHEFGHMIGLGDEYVSHAAPPPGTPATGLITGTGNPPGTATAHSDVNNRVGDTQIDGAVAENNDNIMSLGNTVRPQHYSTFHNALERVTGKTWSYGGEGDAPTIIPGMTTPDGGVIT